MGDYLINWDQTGERLYEAGVSRGVLYKKDSTATDGYGAGVPWNGLTGVTESPSGAEETKLYANNQKYLGLRSAEEFGCTIEAYTYPAEWAECDGSVALATGLYAGQQVRRGFGFAYRTELGNDEMGEDFGYKLHLIYNGTASPSEKSYTTINDSPDAMTLSWEVSTNPVDIGSSYKPTAILTINSNEVDSTKLGALEQILYGTPAVEADAQNNISAADAIPARLPLPAEVIQLLS